MYVCAIVFAREREKGGGAGGHSDTRARTNADAQRTEGRRDGGRERRSTSCQLRHLYVVHCAIRLTKRLHSFSGPCTKAVDVANKKIAYIYIYIKSLNSYTLPVDVVHYAASCVAMHA